MKKAIISVACLSIAVALGCGKDRDKDVASSSGGAGDGGDGSGTADDGNDDGDIKLDVAPGETGGGGDDQGDCEGDQPPADATLTGTVYAPNLEIPISGALVYTASQRPEGITDGNYCPECQEVECHYYYTFTEPDGTFELPAFSGPGQWFVAIKGEFMHITQMDIAEGTTALDPVVSSLPGEWNPDEGHYIPRMAVMGPCMDSIYNVIAKIGLAEVDATGEMVQGTEQFDMYDPFGEGPALLDSLAAMNRYHIIFVPCMCQGSMGYPTALQVEDIRRWTEDGGRWYVTDWANEYLYEPFPVYQTFHQQPSNPDLGLYESDGTVLDPDLLAWLDALPPNLKDIGGGEPTLNDLPTVRLVDNWSGLDATPEVIVQDDEGNDVNVGHYPWVEGPCGACMPGDVRPMTVTARYGCGRLLFSTYHTTELSHPGLIPQELILLYIILEIGACHDKPPPPPPPQG